MTNKIITSEGNIQFVWSDGKIVNVNPTQVYYTIYEDTITFKLVALPKTSGLSIFTTKWQDVELNGETFGNMGALLDAVIDAFAEAGATFKCEVVATLPPSGKTNVIYLVPILDPSTGEINIYDEYIWISDESRFELIGATSIEMGDYVQKRTFAAYTAATKNLIEDDERVTAAALTDLNNKKSEIVRLTQAEYDALPESDKNNPIILYIITDAAPAITSGVVESMIDERTSGDVATVRYEWNPTTNKMELKFDNKFDEFLFELEMFNTNDIGEILLPNKNFN